MRKPLFIAPLFTAAAALLLSPPGIAQASTYEAQSHTSTVVVHATAWPSTYGSLSGIAAALCGNPAAWPQLAAASGISNPRLLQVGQRVVVPCARAGAAPRVSSSGGWVAPLSSFRLSSCYGMRYDPYYHRWQLHDGIDMSVPRGTRVHAIHAGTVIRAGWAGGWGNMVEVNHGGGVTTLYAHQSRVLVRVGQRVAKGQTIGLSGSTGASTGPHLHLRLHLNGEPANPAPFLRSHGVKVGC